MKTVRSTEQRPDQPRAPGGVPAKGRTRLLPAGTLERALEGRGSHDQSGRPLSAESAEGRKA
jgi:hypothetical protein